MVRAHSRSKTHVKEFPLKKEQKTVSLYKQSLRRGLNSTGQYTNQIGPPHLLSSHKNIFCLHLVFTWPRIQPYDNFKMAQHKSTQKNWFPQNPSAIHTLIMGRHCEAGMTGQGVDQQWRVGPGRHWDIDCGR